MERTSSISGSDGASKQLFVATLAALFCSFCNFCKAIVPIQAQTGVTPSKTSENALLQNII